MKTIIIIVFAALNFLSFFLYAADKYYARNKKRRIPEKNLLASAFFLGGAGAFLGMYIFRHKTKHLKFKVLVPIFFAVTLISFVLLYSYNMV